MAVKSVRVLLPLGAVLGIAALAGEPPAPNLPWLEVPEPGLKIEANGSATVPMKPSAISKVILHIPAGGSHINYGTIHTKVNTESADIATRSASGSDGISLTVDLADATSFAMTPGRNSIELEYQDQFGRVKYGSFLLDFSQSASGSRGVAVLPPSRPPEKRTGRLFAVVIGVSHFLQKGRQAGDLKYADRDAKAVYDFFRSPAGGSVAESDSLLLLNDQATATAMRHALFTFLTRPQEQDTVVIYLAGHGAPDPNDPRNLYFLTTDAQVDDMGATAFPMYEMQEVFARTLKARKVITFADTCHGYGFTGERTAASSGNNLINQYIVHYAGEGQRAVITASDISEPSFEDEKWGEGHGVFTYYLLRGLEGEADRNHDGVVTAGEVFAYLQEKVPAATGGHQNPRAMQGIANNLGISTISRTTKKARGA